MDALEEDLPLQQLALRLAMSAPGTACTLNGASKVEYLKDVEEVLKLDLIEVLENMTLSIYLIFV